MIGSCKLKVDMIKVMSTFLYNEIGGDYNGKTKRW